MGPGAEPGFDLGLFLALLVPGLAQLPTLLVGVTAGLLIRRGWLALLAAFTLGTALHSSMLHGPDWGGNIMFLLAFSLPAAIWAGIVHAVRTIVNRSDDRL